MSSHTSNQIKILIVDDESIVIDALQTVLDLHGYSVTGATSGYKALNAIRSDHYCIALVDIVMPEMNGLEIMAEIKRLSASTRIILMTAYSKNHWLVKQAIAAKPDKILYKPIKPMKLVETVNYYSKIFECTDAHSLE